MEINKGIEIIFTSWSISLKEKDRTRKSIRPNVEELFQSWIDIGAAFEDLYTVWLPRTVSAHLPAPVVARAVYAKMKALPALSMRPKKSEKDFCDEWNRNIKEEITQAFMEYFPAPVISPMAAASEPKIYGSMSAKEYNLQRRHAESFPILDTTELEKQWLAQDNKMDSESMIRHITGGSDEDNS